MKDLKRIELVQEMGISEMKGVSGGIIISPIVGPFIPLEVLQRVFDAIIKE